MNDPLLSIPGLGGFLAARNQRAQAQAQQMQQAVSLAGLLHQQEQMQMARETAPLQRQMLEANVSDAQSRVQSRQSLDAAISSLPLDQQTRARLNPQAYVASLYKEDAPQIVPQGAALVQGGRAVFTNPKVEPKSAFEKALDAAGITDPARRQQLITAYLTKQTTHAPAASANVVLNQEREESKAVGQASGKEFVSIQQSGLEAQSKINRMDRIGQLLDGVATGKLTPAATQVAALADSIGIKVDPNLGAKQAAQALSNEIALMLRNPSGGAGMPGALSDRDREFLVSMTPGLSNTPEGNRLIIETAKKLAKRDQEVAKMAREYRAKHGTFDPNFYGELERFSQANPLFTSNAQGTPSAPSSDQFETGKVYVNPKGQRAKYLGNGKWGSP